MATILTQTLRHAHWSGASIPACGSKRGKDFLNEVLGNSAWDHLTNLKGGGERMAFSERKLKACASFWPWGKSFWQVIFNHFSKYAFDMTELWPHCNANN